VSYGFWEAAQIQPPERIWLELPVRTEGTDLSPGIDYPVEKNCSGQRKPFTALFACDDISAIGSIGAFREPGFRMPNASISYG
jgi:DNA-binding LacI/PurR family transcriptional regulator